MTREEAIKFLTLMRKAVSNFEEYGHDKASMVIECDKAEAIDMAIEALSAEAVSRKDIFSKLKAEAILHGLSDSWIEMLDNAEKRQTDKYPWEAIPCEEHYKLPGHDEVMDALEKLTIRKVTDKDETEYLNRTFRHDDGEWNDLTATMKVKPRLVDANDLMDNLPCLKIKKLDCDFCSFYKNKTSECLLEKWIGNAPTVSARPHGEWLPSNIPNEKWVCSECGGACWYYDYQGSLGKSNYCPNCGSDMRWESDTE